MRGVIIGAIWIAIGFGITQLVATVLEQWRAGPQAERTQSPGIDGPQTSPERVSGDPR
jgi:hypothetical protein